jgi:hypothetical protein
MAPSSNLDWSCYFGLISNFTFLVCCFFVSLSSYSKVKTSARLPSAASVHWSTMNPTKRIRRKPLSAPEWFTGFPSRLNGPVASFTGNSKPIPGWIFELVWNVDNQLDLWILFYFLEHRLRHCRSWRWQRKWRIPDSHHRRDGPTQVGRRFRPRTGRAASIRSLLRLFRQQLFAFQYQQNHLPSESDSSQLPHLMDGNFFFPVLIFFFKSQKSARILSNL